jgi:hypothetical protein
VHLLDQSAGGEPFREVEANHSATSRFDNVAADDVIGIPVGALDQDVRLNSRDDRKRRVLVERHDGVHTVESQQNLDPFLGSIDRSIASFVCAHRSIGVHTDDEGIAEAPCFVEVTHVPGMQQVEHAVGEDDSPATALQLARQRCGVFG